MKKTMLLACSLLISLPTFAQTLVKGAITKKVNVAAAPSFFFKVNPAGNKISYTLPLSAASAGGAGVNHLLNVTTGEDSIIPGPWDPVFVGDTGLMVIPVSDRVVTYAFYGINTIVQKGKESSPLFLLNKIEGYYQSAGVLGQAEDGTFHVRVIAESRTAIHPMQDFSYNPNTKSVEATREATSICSNFNLKLPMLSKDGQFLGALDTKTNTSGIFKINDDGNCEKQIDLGIKTGKLNFSYDSKKVTYHLYNKAVELLVSDASQDYVAMPDASYVSDIFVLDLSTKAITRVTANRNSNSMYPDFIKDGQLVFINHPHDKTVPVSFNYVRLPVGRNPASIQSEAQDIIQTRCLNCHSAQHPSGGADLEDQLENFMTPGKPDDSLIIGLVEADIMPLNGPLSAKEKQILRQWVKEGAKLN